MLSKKALDEFKQIYKQEFDQILNDTEALKKAVALLTIFKLIYKPVTKKQLEIKSNIWKM